MDPIYLQVYSDGVAIEGLVIFQEAMVYSTDNLASAYGLDPASLSFDLAEMKAWKRREIRQVVGEYLETTYGRIEINFTLAKQFSGRANEMTPREAAAWPVVRDTYAERDHLLDLAESAQDWRTCRDARFIPPVAI